MTSPERSKGVPRRSRRRLLRCAVFVLACVAALALTEVALRVFDPFGVNDPRNVLRYRLECLTAPWVGPRQGPDLDGTLFRHRPGLEVRFGRFTVRTNALGFRGPEITRDKPAGTRRFLVLGDSVVFGWGVDDEHTFVRRLERDLNAAARGVRYEVVNTGHLMYDTVQEAALFAREGLALDPDLVLLVYVINDIEPTRDYVEAMLAHETRPAAAPAPSFGDRVVHELESRLPACTALVRSLLARGRADAPGQGTGSVPPQAVRNGETGWRRSRAALRRIHGLCAARGIPFLVLDHTLPRLAPLEAFLEAEGIPCREFRFTPAELDRPIGNSLVDPHANPLGHAILLEKLERILREEELVEPR